MVISFSFPVFWGAQSVAHPLDVVYAEVVQGHGSDLSACISMHPETLKKTAGSETLSDAVFEKNIFFEFTSGGVLCASNFAGASHADASSKICYGLKCAGADGKYLFKFIFTESMDEKFVVLGKFKSHGSENIFKLDRANNSSSFAPGSTDFLVLGMEHIGATPAAWTSESGGFQIADGLDHVLFVLVLLLISSTWKRLLINISGFTVGHSISLALALMGILVLPATVIEPAIALTIAYVALRGVLQKEDESLWITVAFGFLHGMGFSYVLEGLQTTNKFEFFRTLLLFNVGIEAGQLVIILLLSPLFYFILTRHRFAKVIVRSFSGVVFLLAVYWAFERIFLS